MPVVIKTSEMAYKDNLGNYHGINAIAEKKIADQISDLDTAITEQETRINNDLSAMSTAVSNTENRIDADISQMYSDVDDIEDQRQTMVAAIASVAGQGTDTTLTQSGVAADAETVGNLISELQGDLNEKIDEPSNEGTSGQFLQTDGNGGRVWATAPGGIPGPDGYSPIANISKSGNVATISITDKVGTTTVQISDGAKGDKGEKGATGSAATNAQISEYLSSVITNPNSPPLDKTLSSDVSAAPADITGSIKGVVQDILTGGNVLDYNSCVSGRLRVSDGAVVQATNQKISDYIPIWPGMIMTRNFIVQSDAYGDVYYNSSKQVIETVSSNYINTKKHEAPAGAAWVRLTIPNSMLVSGEETAIVTVEPKIKQIADKTKWLAVGDSITFGVYSTVQNSEVVKLVGDGWVQQLSAALNYDLTVMASRGMGYTAAVTGKDPENPSGARINLDTLLTRIEEGLSNDYNLITIAFGVNDYNTPSSASLETVALGLNNALERLSDKFINARIVVITPFNCCNADGCTAATRWNCDYELGGRSLADIAHKIQECCDTYGIECINATENFVFNVFNISPDLEDAERLVPDKVHPSLKGHTLLAKGMARYLLF